MLKISVIIPIYKVEQYLCECVDSVLGQTYRNIEVILVDDGSPDGCPQICDEYARKDNRVYVIHKQNGGLSDARNSGLRASTGDYIVFLDSDDYYGEQDFLATVVEATANGTKDAVFFQRTVFYENSDKSNVVKAPYILEWNDMDVNLMLLTLAKNDCLDASSCMKATKRSILLDNELYFKKGIYSEDVEWFSRYIMFVNSITLINKPCYFYRKREGSITATLSEKNIKDLLYTIQTHTTAIRELDMDLARKYSILSYHSYQYYIIIGLANSFTKGEVRDNILKECKKYRWLTLYSVSKKTKMCAWVLKVCGIKMASLIYGYHIKHK